MSTTCINATPWVQQNSFNILQTAALATWTNGPAMPQARYSPGVLVTNSRAYILGNGSPSNTILTATIDSGGILSSWSSAGTLPFIGVPILVALTKNKAYIIGAYVSGDTSYTYKIYKAPIDPDGTLGTFVLDPITFAPGLDYASVFILKNNIYIAGLRTPFASSTTVYHATIDENGDIGVWSALSNLLPTWKTNATVAVTSSRVYLLGGGDRFQNPVSSVFSAPYDSNGILGAWTDDTGIPLPGSALYSQCIVTKDTAYYLGGQGSTAQYIGTIDASGVITSWTTGTVLPFPIYRVTPIVTSSRVYILSDTDDTTTKYASFSGGLNNYLDKSYIEELGIYAGHVYAPLVSLAGYVHNFMVLTGDVAPEVSSVTCVMHHLVARGFLDVPVSVYTGKAFNTLLLNTSYKGPKPSYYSDIVNTLSCYGNYIPRLASVLSYMAPCISFSAPKAVLQSSVLNYFSLACNIQVPKSRVDSTTQISNIINADLQAPLVSIASKPLALINLNTVFRAPRSKVYSARLHIFYVSGCLVGKCKIQGSANSLMTPKIIKYIRPSGH